MYLGHDNFSSAASSSSTAPYTVSTLHQPGSSECNEDVVLQTGSLYGVFDGATSLDTSGGNNGLTGGLLAARLAAQAFQTTDQDLVTAAKAANRSIREAQLAAGVPFQDRHRLWSTSMAVIRLHGSFIEYCYTGDAMVMLLFSDGSHRLLTPELNIDRETLHMWQNLPPSLEPIHLRLADQIRAVRLRMNIDYGVLNGEPESLHFLGHGTQSLSGVSSILLFTDGLMPPKSDPWQDSDWHTFAQRYRAKGLEGLYQYTHMLQRSDPDCRRFPRFKQHDDVAAVAVTVNTYSA